MADLRTSLFGVVMASPFILASGPLSYGAEGIWAAYRAGAGGVTTKTFRLQADLNPTPHITLPRSPNLRGSLLNSEKSSDLALERWVEEELPALSGHPGIFIASVGLMPEEADAIAGRICDSPVIDAIECVSYKGSWLVDCVRAVRAHTDLPVLAKLSFNWGENFLGVAEAALEAGASGFTAIDSVGPTFPIDVETARPALGGLGNRGWLSGAAIRPIAQAMVADLVTRFDRPVIGTGGIIHAEDAIEMTMAGASAMGAASAPLLHGLEWFGKTAARLSQWLDAHGYAGLSNVRGSGLRSLQEEEDTQRLAFAFNALQCTKCNQCVVLCPYGARQLAGDRPRSPELQQVLDESRCRSCGLCVEVCKPHALTYANWPR